MDGTFAAPESVKRQTVVTEQKTGGEVKGIRFEIQKIEGLDEVLMEVAVDVGAPEPLRKSDDLMVRETDPVTGIVTVKGYKAADLPLLAELKKKLGRMGITVK